MEGLNEILARGGVVVYDAVADRGVAVEQCVQEGEEGGAVGIQEGGLHEIVHEMDGRVVVQNLDGLETRKVGDHYALDDASNPASQRAEKDGLCPLRVGHQMRVQW